MVRAYGLGFHDLDCCADGGAQGEEPRDDRIAVGMICDNQARAPDLGEREPNHRPTSRP